ncbi:hypothetical protein [Streptomyces sp. ISL-94]|uniref:hypothetical protein n=1 Tax=Streptomyces sp. ISL-94 TaxID=2819190 RepID=UPI001BE85712|nr:hypothetical protein [Streptomyces sp. ISL-94]MBT2477620.1 hypothetical protein [Streptomyces sp. ISL-94]
MSRYLEEAAELLRKSVKETEATAARSGFPSSYNGDRMAVAREFATLAAIDKGLLPAEFTADILRAIADRHPA